MNSFFEKIFTIDTEQKFDQVALEVFDYQFKHVPVYREYVSWLNRTTPKSYLEIPHLPISFFKTHSVRNESMETKKVFKSSGTGNQIRSNHFVADLAIYERSFMQTYVQFFGKLENQIIFALLPNYVSQGDSSLIYMVNHLISKTNNSLSGYYMNDSNHLIEAIQQARKQEKELVLFGVSYALLDLAEQNIDLYDVKIIETGGMKGRRQELTKYELHTALKKGLNVNTIFSEYGMCELLSQAYSEKEEVFSLPPWMRFSLREVNDPFQASRENKTGGVNIIDLANIYSCSFLETHDLGRNIDGKLRLMGRFDHSDVRGCNLLLSNDDFNEK
jgi:phenylacetate-coenzyme A ligase PaaK-like adenylate-forming protein